MSYIIITHALNIKNARNQITHSFWAGDRVKVEATTEFYWVTEHGAIWFSQAVLESEHLFEANKGN